jgi:hypothetical protein
MQGSDRNIFEANMPIFSSYNCANRKKASVKIGGVLAKIQMFSDNKDKKRSEHWRHQQPIKEHGRLCNSGPPASRSFIVLVYGSLLRSSYIKVRQQGSSCFDRQSIGSASKTVNTIVFSINLVYNPQMCVYVCIIFGSVSKNTLHYPTHGPILQKTSTILQCMRSLYIDSYFLDIGCSWRWVGGSFTLLLLYPQGMSPSYPLGWVDPRADEDDIKKLKFLTLPRLELIFLGPGSSP